MENREIINLTEDMEAREQKMKPFRNERLKMIDNLGDVVPVVSTIKSFWESVGGKSIVGRELSYRERVDKAIISGGVSLATALEYSGYTGSTMFVGAGMAMGMQTSEFIDAMIKEGPHSLKDAAVRAREKHPQAAAILDKFSDYCMKKGDAFRKHLIDLKHNLDNNGTINGPVKETF